MLLEERRIGMFAKSAPRAGKQKGGAQKTKGGARASGKNGRARRLRKIGEQPLYANQHLCVPLRFLSWVCV
jgi:hypothetical protein